jgi:hypothetical protein
MEKVFKKESNQEEAPGKEALLFGVGKSRQDTS